MPAGEMLKEHREPRRVFVNRMVNEVTPFLVDRLPLEEAEYWLSLPPPILAETILKTLAARARYPVTPTAPGTHVNLIA